MAFTPTFLSALDAIRAIPGRIQIPGPLGLRVFTVTIRRRTHSGERPGAQNASYVDIDTKLTNTCVDGVAVNVRCRQVSRSEAIASGGLFTNRDLKVGPMTPPYPQGAVTGGFDDSTMDPAPVASATEIFWNVTGPGLPSGGGWFNKLSEEATSLHTYIFLRANGRRP